MIRFYLGFTVGIDIANLLAGARSTLCFLSEIKSTMKNFMHTVIFSCKHVYGFLTLHTWIYNLPILK